MIFPSAKVCTHVQIQKLSILLMNNDLNVGLFLTQSHHKASEDLKYSALLIWTTFILHL